ncbi:hypothetical protein AVEN_73661-1 [Araneus ventricosus]|uniref:Uncharacterized protein n=1 Tax=Araneus ventricosus TaxID=182803 RepID=A0A4Y2HQI6_ARAVE|nr:hypothetical protein AVEN_73661-1 [Araneus ventricosus]
MTSSLLNEKDELIPDYKISVSANRLNDRAQKEPNIYSSKTEISNERHLSSVGGQNIKNNIKRKISRERLMQNDFRQVKTIDKSDPLNVDGVFSQSRCCEDKSCDSSTVEDHIFNAEMCIKKESQDRNAENNESKCEAMDTS